MSWVLKDLGRAGWNGKWCTAGMRGLPMEVTALARWRQAWSADGSDSPGALMTSLTAPARAGTVE